MCLTRVVTTRRSAAWRPDVYLEPGFGEWRTRHGIDALLLAPCAYACLRELAARRPGSKRFIDHVDRQAEARSQSAGETVNLCSKRTGRGANAAGTPTISRTGCHSATSAAMASMRRALSSNAMVCSG